MIKQMKRAKIIGQNGGIIKMECPDCKRGIYVTHNKNRYAESFYGCCWQCGWKFLLKDKDFAYVQPDSPFFELIYKYQPEKMAEKKKKEEEWKEEQRKITLQEKYFNRYRGGRKPWERKAIEKEVLGI